MKKIISQKVSLESKYLDSDYEEHILKKIKINMENTCSYNHGYIISVNKILDIGENMISNANSSVIFNVKYEVDILKPEIDDILNGTVCMIIEDGILLDIDEKIKILISAQSMKNYEYNKDKNVFVDGKDIIQMGMNIDTQVIQIQYEKHNFSYIGKLKNNT